MTGFEDKDVLVTGAASGMGRAVVSDLLACGARVHAVDMEKVQAPVASRVQCDLRDEAALTSAVACLPSLQAAFLCAGLPQTKPAIDVVTVNFLANRELVRSLVPHMAPFGGIAVVASLTYGWERFAKRTRPLLDTASFEEGRRWCEANLEMVGDPYVFSKMAITAWCVEASIDLAPQRVRLNVLGPGMTDTPMLLEFRDAVGEQLDAMPCPMGRPSTAEEQAAAMLLLNDPACTYLTGSVLFNDGGASASFACMASGGLS